MAYKHKSDDVEYSFNKAFIEQIRTNKACCIKRNILDAAFVLAFLGISIYAVIMNPDYCAPNLSPFQSSNLIFAYWVNLFCLLRYSIGYSLKQSKQADDFARNGSNRVYLVPLYKGFISMNIYFVVPAIVLLFLLDTQWYPILQLLTCIVIVGVGINGILEVLINTFNIKPIILGTVEN